MAEHDGSRGPDNAEGPEESSPDDLTEPAAGLIRGPTPSPEILKAMRLAAPMPPETIKAMRRAMTIPPETIKAMQRAMTIPPEQLKAIQASVTIPREQLEAMQRAMTIPPERLEAMQRAMTIPPEQLKALQASLTIPPKQLKALQRAMTIPPEQLKALQAAITIPPEKIKAIRASLTIPPETIKAMQRSLTMPLETMESLRKAAKAWVEAWEAALPANWTGLDTTEVAAIIELVTETGYSLVWLPRIEIVRELMDADRADVPALILGRKEDVLDDAEKCLSDIDRPELMQLRAAIEESIAAFRAGHHRAAQALAAVVFTSEVHAHFEMGTTASRRRMEAADPMSGPIGRIRIHTIFRAAVLALAEFRPDRAVPVRRSFNRHNSAHRITTEQWTEANALSSIMLAASFLREMHV
jgi:hypothetical protein